MQRISGFAFALALALLTASCDINIFGNSEADDSPDIEGTYSLASINGSSLPFDAGTSECSYMILSGSLVLSSSGNFQIQSTAEQCGGEIDQDTGTGSYDLDGMTVTLTFDQASRDAGFIESANGTWTPTEETIELSILGAIYLFEN